MLLFKSLTILLLFPGSPEPDTAYRKYEKDNMAFCRKIFTFEYPKFDNKPAVVVTQTPKSKIGFGPTDTLKVTWDIPAEVERLRDIHIPEGDVKIEGFRVQLYAGGSYETCNKVKADFISSFPETRVYGTWNVPHFRVRAGDFVSHNDALRFMNAVKEKFPGAFVVADKIEVHKKIGKDPVPEDGPTDGGE